mmetsp:Transcript_21885/g.57023  ORF Transcript_21885/g.57023 Transcript_21885/m.57023 type:complete len:201 (+) Transcript_21885:1964-2566(+)
MGGGHGREAQEGGSRTLYCVLQGDEQYAGAHRLHPCAYPGGGRGGRGAATECRRCHSRRQQLRPRRPATPHPGGPPFQGPRTQLPVHSARLARHGAGHTRAQATAAAPAARPTPGYGQAADGPCQGRWEAGAVWAGVQLSASLRGGGDAHRRPCPQPQDPVLPRRPPRPLHHPHRRPEPQRRQHAVSRFQGQPHPEQALH